MKRFELILLVAVLFGWSCAQKVVTDHGSAVRNVVTLSDAATQPSDSTPTLPTGHPDLSKLNTGGALPSGHPALGSSTTQPATAVETTTQEPDWFVQMRHMMVQPSDKGLSVMDMLAVENPSERAWVGHNNVVFQIALPAGATDVQFTAGFDDKTRVENGKVIQVSPLPPGTTKYRMQYTLPLTNGHAELTAVAPAPVSTMMVFYPADGTTLVATGLKGPETIDMGNGNMRYFKADEMGPGNEVKLSIGGASAAPAAPTEAPETASPARSSVDSPQPMNGSEIAKGVAGIGALMIFLLGGALMLTKPRSAKTGKKR